MKKHSLVLIILVFLFSAHMAFALIAVVNAQQSQETRDELQRYVVATLSERITRVEQENLPPRVKILENDMDELKWLGRGIALAIAGQFVLALMNINKTVKGRV